MEKYKIAIGNDHAAVDMKNEIVSYLKEKGQDVVSVGTDTSTSCNYPEYAYKVATLVRDKKCDFGILICGTGVGMSISANKVKGIRAVVCSESFSARMARKHNDANVLCFGARVVGIETAKMIVDEFLGNNFEGGRHENRVKMIMDIQDEKFNL